MHNFLTFLLLFVTSGVIAQEPVFSWGTLTAKPSTPAEIRILGKSANGYFIVSSREPSESEQRSLQRSAFSPVIHAEYISKEGLRTFSKDISTGRAEDYVNTVFYNGNLHLIYALYDKDAAKNILWAKTISTEGTDIKPVQLTHLDAAKMGQRGLFYVAVSPDGDKLLAIGQPEYAKNVNEQLTITLFSQGFTPTWSSTQTFSYGSSRAVDNRPFVNNSGTAFILKQVNAKGADDYWSVFTYAGQAFSEHRIPLDGKKMASFTQAFSPEGDFTVGGYLKDEGAAVRVTMGDKATASFIFQVDAAGQSLKAGKVNPFTKRSDMLARQILFNNGSIILAGERYTVSDRAAARTGEPKTNGSMFARDHSYNGMDIYLDGFDPAGKPLFSSTIEKNNSSRNDLGYWLSFLSAVVDNKLHVVFMDNFSRYDNKAISINTPNVMVHATVDPLTGSVQKPVPVTDPGPVGGKSGDTYLRPNAFLQSGKTFIVRAENNTHYRMGEMKF